MKNKGFIKYIVALILLFITIIIIENSFASKYKNIEKVNKFDDLNKFSSFKIEVPAFIKDEKDISISIVSNDIVEISNENILMRIAKFIDYNADPLGIYEEFEYSTSYQIDNAQSKIKYFKYRTDNKAVIINWVQDDVMYACIIKRYITLDEAIELIDIDKEYLESSNYNAKTESNNKEFSIDIEKYDGIIKVSNVKNELQVYSIDGHNILIIAYNEIEKYFNLYTNSEEDLKFYMIDNKLIIYNNDNPFQDNDEYFNYYNDFILTVENELLNYKVQE